MTQKNKILPLCKRITTFCLTAAILFSDFLSIPSFAQEVTPISELPKTTTADGEGLTDIVLTGTSISGKTVDMPVYCIRKGTAPGKHAALFFAGDGYTADQQDSFIADVKAKVDFFLQLSPINYFADRFDAYAVLVPSEGSGKYSSTNDTFFQIASATIGSKTKSHLFTNIRNPLAAALNIHKDNDVYTTVLISNAPYGQGMSGNYYSVIGRGSHEVFAHETGHAAHDLTDEYYMGAKLNAGSKTKANRIYITDIAKDGLDVSELNNLTMYDYDKLDITKVRWSAYLGFRGTYIDGFDDTADAAIRELRPNHKASMMGDAGKPFCPVCESEIFKQLNNRFGNPYSLFVPQPEFSYSITEHPIYFCNQQNKANYKKPDKTYLPSNEKLGAPEAEFKGYDSLSDTDSSGDNTDLADAFGHDLTFRTVVLPFGSPVNLKLKVTVLDKDNRIRSIREKDFNIQKIYGSGYASSYATSLELTIPKSDWNDITGGLQPQECRVIGEVIDNTTNTVLKTTGPLQTVRNAALTISAYYGNETVKTSTPVENYKSSLQLIDIQQPISITPPSIEGYTLTGPKETITSLSVNSDNGTCNLNYYYTKNSGTVTQILLNENGTEVTRKTSSVPRGTLFVPKESDFTIPSGYQLKLPPSFTYDGLSSGKTLTYKYEVSKTLPTPNAPVTISLSKNKLSFDTIGSSKTITAKVTPSKTPVTWKSSNKKVASVTNGKIKAIGNGKAVITANAGGKSVSCTVTVSQKSKKVSITYGKTSISGKTLKITKGKQYQLNASVSPKNTNASNKKIRWSSSNKKIATVSKSGKIKALKTGTVTIKAQTADGRKTSVKFKVIKEKVKVTSLKLTASTKKLQRGKKLTLKASTSPITAANSSLTWKSSNSKIAKVNSKGVVTAVKAGKVKITAASRDGSNKKASITLTIVKSSKK